MKDKIIDSIQKHLEYMDAVSMISAKMLEAAESEDESRLLLESNNRERLIKIIEELQNKTEIMIKALPSLLLSHDLIEIVKLWGQDVICWVEDIDQIDQMILQHLEHLKENTTKEIASIFKSKQQFKGYNLNSVRK
jgi:hypothetical protein